MAKKQINLFEEAKKKQREEEFKKQMQGYQATPSYLDTYFAEKKYADIQNDIYNTNLKADNSLKNWQTSSGLNDTRKSIQNTQSKLKSYQRYMNKYGDASQRDSLNRELDSIQSMYAETLRQIDSREGVYSQYMSANAYNKARNNTIFGEKYKGYSYDQVQEAMKKLNKDSDEYKWLSEYTGYTDLKDFDKALANTKDEVGFNYNANDYKMFTRDSNGKLKLNQNMDYGQGAKAERDNSYKNRLQEARNIHAIENKFDLFEDYLNKEDFAEVSAYDPNVAHDVRYTSREKDKRVNALYAHLNGDGDNSQTFNVITSGYDLMTDEEKAVFNYKYKVEGIDSASDYLDEMDITLSKRRYDKETAQWERFADNHGVVASVASVPYKQLGALTSGVETLKEVATGHEYNPYASNRIPTNFAYDTRNYVAENIEENTQGMDFLGANVPSQLYQMGMSGADMVAGSLMFGGNGYAVIMGTDAASIRARELKEQGASDAEIATGALTAGAFELVFEKLSIDKLLNMKNADSVLKVVKNALTQAGVEATEEMSTEVANILFDTISRGELSDAYEQYQAYLDQGYSEAEAKKMLAVELGKQVAWAGISGALLGGGMGGAFSAIQYKRGDQAEVEPTEVEPTALETPNLETPVLEETETSEAETVPADLSRTSDVRTIAEELEAEGLYANPDTQDFEAYAESMTPHMAQTYKENYNGEDVRTYAHAFDLVYSYGKNAMGIETAMKHKGTLSEAQITAIYKAGVETRGTNVKQARIKALVAQNQHLVAQHKGKFTNDGSVDVKKLNPSQRIHYNFLEKFSEYFGVDIEVSLKGEEEGFNGQYSRATNKIRIDLNAVETGSKGIGAAVVPTLSHELTHWLETKAPKAYQALSEQVLNTLTVNGAKDADQLIADEIERNKGLGRDVNREYAINEIVARSCEDMFSNSKQASEFLAKLDEDTQKTVVDKIKALLTELRNFVAGLWKELSGTKEAKLLWTLTEEFNEIQKLWETAFDEAREVNKALDANTLASLSQENEVHFSDKDFVQTRELVVLHNLTEEKLSKTLDLGGFPMPSLAVTKVSIGHTNFGDISLVFGKETIDPKNRKNKVYGADAWTPTFPRVEYDVDMSKSREISRTIRELVANNVPEYYARQAQSLVNGLEYTIDNYGGEEGIIERAKNEYGMKAAFLASKGETVEEITKEERKEMGSGEVECSKMLIEEFGEDIDSIAAMSGRAMMEEHGYRIKKTLVKYFMSTSDKIDEDFANEVVDSMKGLDIIKHVRIARDYHQTGGVKVETSVDYGAMQKSMDSRINTGEYEAWLENLFYGLVKDSGFRKMNVDPYTPSGNRKSFKATHLPITTENIVKAMLSEGNVRNVSGFNGAKSVRAVVTEDFKSISAIKKSSNKLQNMSQDEFDEINDKLNSRLNTVIADIVKGANRSGNVFIDMDTVGECILEACNNPTTENIKKELGYWKCTNAQAEEIVSIINAIKDMPVNMFEAKPQRVVGFDEIKAAIIPDDTSAKLKEKLGKHNIPIREYKAGDDEARKAIIQSMDNVQFSDRDYAPTFYSHMTNVIDGIKQNKVGANSVVNYLKGKGVKDEEIKWSGIETFLEGKKSVTKEELQEFARGSMLEIEESVYSYETYTHLEKLMREHMDVELYNYVYEDGDIDIDGLYVVLDDYLEGGDITEEQHDELLSATNAFWDSGATKWHDYKMEGGSNYRELLFKLPNSDYSNYAMEQHWREEGILAHARIQDFETKDGKMLFIEEIQSDWHNEGHEVGYKGGGKKTIKETLTQTDWRIRVQMSDYIRGFARTLENASYEKRIVPLSWVEIVNSLVSHITSYAQGRITDFKEYINRMYGYEMSGEELEPIDELVKDYSNIGKEVEKVVSEDGKVPDAPFRNNYHEYVIKRLLRMAAEEGYDSIGWTTAEMQSNRWSEQYAEGYRIEYDQDIPKFLNKYGKKWGGKVDRTTLSGSDEPKSVGQVIRAFKNAIDEISANISNKAKQTQLSWGGKRDTTEDILARLRGAIDGTTNIYDASWDSTKLLTDIEEAFYDAELFDEMGVVAEARKNRKKYYRDEVWHFAIPASMKESVLYEGQVMFSDRDTQNIYDKAGEAERLRKENRQLKELIAEMRDTFSANKASDSDLSATEVKRVANRLIRNGHSKIAAEDLIVLLRECYTYIMTNPNATEADIFDRALYVAKRVLMESRGRKVKDDNAKAVLKAITSTEVSLTSKQIDSAKALYGDDYKKVLRRCFKIKAGAISLDSQWQEWVAQYPELFSEVGDTQQIEDIVEIVNGLRETAETIEDLNTADNAREMAVSVVEGFWDVAPLTQEAKESKDFQKVRYENRSKAEILADNYQLLKEKKAQKESYENILKRVRDDRDAKLKESNELHKKRMSDYRDNLDRKALVNRIIKEASTLKSWTLNEKKDRPVPDVMKKPVLALLSAIDYSSKQLLNHGVPTKRDESLKKAFREIEDMAFKLNDATITKEDLSKYGGYVDFPQGFLEKVHEISKDVNDIGDKINADNGYILNQMTVEQLEDLAKLITTMKHSITTMNKCLATRKLEQISSLATNTIAYLEELTDRKNATETMNMVKDFVNFDMALPVYVFDRFGEGGKKIFNSLMDGQDKLAFNTKKIDDFVKDAYKAEQQKKWSREIIEVELLDATSDKDNPIYNKVKMTIAQAMSLYCLYKRPQAKQHMLVGGIRIATFKDGKTEFVQTKGSTISSTEIENIISMLPREAIEVADKLQAFMIDVCGEWGNKISMLRYGIKQFEEEFYFPIRVEKNNIIINAANEKENSIFRLLNMGFTKKLNPKADNKLVVYDIFDVFVTHTSEMAKYNAFALPLLDCIKWFNYSERVPSSDRDSNQKGDYSVKKSLEETYGNEAKQYITHLLEDINGGHADGRGIKIVKNLVRNYKIAAVAGNLRVIALQPTSLIRATALMNPKYITKALTTKPRIKKNIEESKEHCGIALYKSYGFYDTSIQKGMEEVIKKDKSGRDKVMDAFLKPIGGADQLTLGYLWKACEFEVRDTQKNLKVGSDEYYQAVNDRMRDIVYRTQVVDSSLTRSQVMRNKDGWAQSITPFLSEFMVSWNMLYGSLFDWSMDARKEGSYKRTAKKHARKFARVFGAYALTSSASAVVMALMDALRDLDADDDDEKNTDTIIEMLLDALMTQFNPAYAIKKSNYYTKAEDIKYDDGHDARVERIIDNFVANINLLNGIPLIKDAMSAIQGYDLTRMDTAFINSAISAYENTQKLMEGKESASLYKTVYSWTKTFSQTSGLPIGNAMRDAVAIWNKIVKQLGWDSVILK